MLLEHELWQQLKDYQARIGKIYLCYKEANSICHVGKYVWSRNHEADALIIMYYNKCKATETIVISEGRHLVDKRHLLLYIVYRYQIKRF